MRIGWAIVVGLMIGVGFSFVLANMNAAEAHTSSSITKANYRVITR